MSLSIELRAPAELLQQAFFLALMGRTAVCTAGEAVLVQLPVLCMY